MIRIITDSASDILPEECPENLTVIPMTIAFGDTVYHDAVDLTHERFYELLVESDTLPSTGAVAPGVYAEAFEAARAAGEDVLVLTLSSKLSGTYQNALLAAEGVDRVRVVDTLNASVGERILVERALMLVEEGLSLEEVAASLERDRERAVILALMDTLEYARRGGRVPGLLGSVGQVLAIKPVLGVEGGEVKVVGKARGSKNGKNLLSQEIVRHGGIDFRMPIALGYSGLSDRLLRKYVEDNRSLWEQSVESLLCYSMGATIGTHAGPGAIAVAYFHK